MTIINLFRRRSLAQVDADTLERAQYELAEHKAAAEYHDAMISMYQKRILRLQSSQKVAA